MCRTRTSSRREDLQASRVSRERSLVPGGGRSLTRAGTRYARAPDPRRRRLSARQDLYGAAGVRVSLRGCARPIRQPASLHSQHRLGHSDRILRTGIAVFINTRLRPAPSPGPHLKRFPRPRRQSTAPAELADDPDVVDILNPRPSQSELPMASPPPLRRLPASDRRPDRRSLDRTASRPTKSALRRSIARCLETTSARPRSPRVLQLESPASSQPGRSNRLIGVIATSGVGGTATSMSM